MNMPNSITLECNEAKWLESWESSKEFYLNQYSWLEKLQLPIKQSDLINFYKADRQIKGLALEAGATNCYAYLFSYALANYLTAHGDAKKYISEKGLFPWGLNVGLGNPFEGLGITWDVLLIIILVVLILFTVKKLK